MNVNIKYLKDGNKVAVIANTSDQYIVRNIFIDDKDNEIIDGKEYIVKEVFDNPVIVESWRSRDVKYQENKNKSKLEELEREYKNLCAQSEHVQSILNNMVNINSPKLKKNMQMVIDFISLKFKFYLKESYNGFEILTLKDMKCDYDKKINLLKVVGSSKGELSFEGSKYSDDSGGSYSLWPFKTKEECLKQIKKICFERFEENKNNYVVKKSYNSCVEHNIDIPKKYIKTCKDRLTEAFECSMKTYKRELESKKDQISKVEKEFSELKIFNA
jgi:hypothetical protein